MWEVAFSYLDVLEEIYGKDRATGKGAETFVEAIENIEREEAAILSGKDPIDLSIDEDDGGYLVTQPPSIERASGSSSRKVKKQKVIQQKEIRIAREFDPMKETLEAMSMTLETFISHMDIYFGTIAKTMARK